MQNNKQSGKMIKQPMKSKEMIQKATEPPWQPKRVDCMGGKKPKKGMTKYA